MERLFAMSAQCSNCDSVATQDHLVKKEVILDRGHFPTDVVEPTKPDICLLCNRGVEVLFAVIVQQLRIQPHVARLQAECICGLMLGTVVKCVNAHPHVLEECQVAALNFPQGIAI
jgi:hypothetical protein